MLKSGLYEQVINRQISQELDQTDRPKKVVAIDAAEASKILAKYLSEVLERSLESLRDTNKAIAGQVSLVNKLITVIQAETGEHSVEMLSVDERAEQLLALMERQNNIQAIDGAPMIIRPETSISISSLFTNAIREPNLYTELKKEIASCDRIDLLVSFIKWSGLRMIIEELRTFTQKGGQLRIITTSYMGATDVKAIEELRQLPNTEVKISYDTKRTRLHAKTYVFYRETGFSTAYVGSSNLSNAAISSGMEWNVKVTAKDLPDTLKKIAATFESYWNNNEFEMYKVEQRDRLARALKSERLSGTTQLGQYLFDIAPYPYQQEILDKLDAERKVRGYYKNLVVAATGTGKTVIAAFDYRRFCRENPGRPNRLLFVAHRQEILTQSVACFRGVLKDANFGDLFVGEYHPDRLDQLFMSVQTFNSQGFHEKTTPGYYDYIVIDEFHHSAAPTYQKLLAHYQPQVLLGLTATPERMDGKSILEYFDNRIAAEIRLPEAIDRKLLSPFQYFGVTDVIDLDALHWSRGGYEKSELTNLYALSVISAERRADHVIRSILRYVTDFDEVKGLGFCVSVEHAKFMANYFNERNIPSIHLSGESFDEERNTAKARLVRGRIRFIFVVDLYNEGVDIPEVNTVLFLRPTESLTVFLQQLGRGLRLADKKECLTVLDFIGQANKKYRFEEKFAALLASTARSVQLEIRDGFTSVPKGCFIQLERKAQEYVLSNIKSAFGARAGLIARLATFEEDSGLPVSLANFLDYYHLDARALYERGTFSRLCTLAGVRDEFSEEMEGVLTNAFSRICGINSSGWIRFLLEFLPTINGYEAATLSKPQKTMLQMFYVTLWNESAENLEAEKVRNNLHALAASPILFDELMELLHYNFDKIDLVGEAIDLGFDCPLELHCNYSLRQIATAMDYYNYGALQGLGVKYFPEKKTDVFFVTLNKSDKEYSPTTMYNDYSINEWLFHWQSQSTTSAESATGKRYIHQRQTGNQILLFIRESKKDNFANASPYTFLGLADYIKHDGSRPMNITWQLRAPIPAKFLKKTNKLVVG